MSAAENVTPPNPLSTVEGKLKFIATQSKEHNLAPEFVFEVIKNHACAEARSMQEDPFDKLFRMFGENLPYIATILQQMYGKDSVKMYRRISIENEDKSIFTPFSIDLKEGDFVTVKLETDKKAGVIVTNYNKETGEITGIISSIPVGEKDEVKTYTHVLFTHSHIFDYQPKSPAEKATANSEENLVNLDEVGYDILKHNVPTKDKPLS